MTKTDEVIISNLRERGLEYTAKYVETYGSAKMNPSFRSPSKASEEFYKQCVEEGHPWDWYFEFPEESIF